MRWGKYTLSLEANPPGYKTYTITLSQRGKGVVFEASENNFNVLMKRVAEFLAGETGI